MQNIENSTVVTLMSSRRWRFDDKDRMFISWRGNYDGYKGENTGKTRVSNESTSR